MKYLHDSPLSTFDYLAGYAPLCEKLARLKSAKEVEELTNRFSVEFNKVIEAYPNIQSHRAKSRISYVIGCAICLNNDEYTLTPSDTVFKALELINKTLDPLTSIDKVADIPMENGLWAVELASLIEPLCITYKFTTEQQSLIQLHLVNAFNEGIKFASSTSIINEERTKNTLSTDIGKRMKASIEEHIKDEKFDDTDLQKSIDSFTNSIISYYDWIKAIEKSL